MSLSISLTNIQHVKRLDYTFNLSCNGLIAITGKNGAGKTTLARAIRMLSFADTFEKTASGHIFTAESSINYSWDGQSFIFMYDPSLKTLNCRSAVPKEWKHLISCELSIPHGERFNFFRSISDADLDIRRSLIVGDFSIPEELIAFLHEIYPDNKFDDLVEIRIRKAIYYCILRPDDRYVREDYFSSGEYFLVSLYRRIRSGYKLIFVDEIDISLDASAQVRLVEQLRGLCSKYHVNIGFTTHSLALMKTLSPDELSFMEIVDNVVTIRPTSYNFIKSILYGFRGWDRYILTEDDVLKEFVEYLIETYCKDIFYRYIVIYIGGSGNVTDLLRRNKSENFLADSQNVIAILDGDQKQMRHANKPDTYCIPIANVERALYDLYQQSDFKPRLRDGLAKEPKVLFNNMLRQHLMAKREIFKKICEAHNQEVRTFAQQLQSFLAR